MRCLACNIELTDYEATRKDKQDLFIDLCNSCYGAGSVNDSARLDLLSEADINYEKDSCDDYLTYGHNDI